jgi:hypothetical protein
VKRAGGDASAIRCSLTRLRQAWRRRWSREGAKITAI